MVNEVAGPGVDVSVMLTVAGLSVAVTVKIFAEVGSVTVTLACPFEPVIAGFGEKLPFKVPMAKVMGAPTTITPAEFLAFTVIGKGRTLPTPPTGFPPQTTLMESPPRLHLSLTVPPL